MDINPYQPPSSSSTSPTDGLTSLRRLDLAIIAAVFFVATCLSFAMLFIPSLNDILRPRFGSTLDLFLVPAMMLGLYLWRPAPKMLWFIAFLAALAAAFGGYSIWRLGTVETITNPYIHRLPSAYYFSVIPGLAASVYLTLIAWLLRKHEPYVPRQSKNAR